MRHGLIFLFLSLTSCIDPDKIEKDVDKAVDEAVDKSIAGCERIFNEKLITLLAALTEIVLPLKDEVNNQIAMTPDDVVTILREKLGCTEIGGFWDCSASTLFICPNTCEETGE